MRTLEVASPMYFAISSGMVEPFSPLLDKLHQESNCIIVNLFGVVIKFILVDFFFFQILLDSRPLNGSSFADVYPSLNFNSREIWQENRNRVGSAPNALS
jgi:hypothetical protein